MTQKEKIRELKTTICFLYEKEGRSKSYISRLLDVERKVLIAQIKEWGLVQANIHRLTPSNQKFLNKNIQLIKSRLDNNVPLFKICEELKVSNDYLRHIIDKSEVLKKAKTDWANRLKEQSKKRKNDLMEKSSRIYNFEELDNEEWKEILGYEGYFISNMGRIKKYAKRYKAYYLLKKEYNKRTGREYIKIQGKMLQVSRLVGFAFVEGYSKEKNTIDHIDNNPLNNCSSNLEWVSQGENNKRAYDRGKKRHKGYSKNKKFKKIILDGKYEFKTIMALSKFLNVSQTQVQRYITKETVTKHEFKFIY